MPASDVEPAPAPVAPPPPPIAEPEAEAAALPPLPPPALSAEGDAPAPGAPHMKPLPLTKQDEAPTDAGVLAEVLVAPPGVPFKPPEKAPGLSLGRLAAVIGMIVLLLGGGYFGYIKLTSKPSVPPVTEAPPEPVVPAPVAVPPAAPVPGPAVEPEKPVAEVAHEPAPAPVPPAPASAPAPTAPVAPPAPGVEFLTWIDSVKISGVFNGTPPRAIVNGLLVLPGDTIDATRGIVFDHLDAEHKKFYFRDRSGAIVTKSY